MFWRQASPGGAAGNSRSLACAREVAWREPRHVVTVRHLATSGALRHATVEAIAAPK
jgi:hypothetical protein